LNVLVNGHESACVDAADRGLQYGDGLFETLAVHAGTPLLWSEHMQRLADGCARLRLPPPDPECLQREVMQVCAGQERAVAKVIITAGVAGRGYRRESAAPPTRVVSAHAWPAYPDSYAREGVAVRWCDTVLGINPRLAGIKHLNRLEHVLARAEWAMEFAEGLMCDSEGYVVEGTMSNVFAVIGATVLTPAVTVTGVAGVMRSQVLQWVRAQGYACHEKRMTPAVLEAADEIFLTNSIIGVWPVRTLASRSYALGETTYKIQKATEAAQCFYTVA
jgi:4-amino-4-deoxychorismate lyase